MSRYTVAFTVNGTVKEVDAKSVKIGNRYLQCQGRVNGDDQVVAMIPFDAVSYIVHDSVTVSLDAASGGSDADAHTVMQAVENKADTTE